MMISLEQENDKLRKRVLELEEELKKKENELNAQQINPDELTMQTTTNSDELNMQPINSDELNIQSTTNSDELKVNKQTINYNELNKPLLNWQISRYSRHILLPDIGVKGQERLCKGSVLIIGLGGLGSSCAMYLAAAGVGRLGFVDFDTVDVSNLHRQIVHQEASQGKPKVLSAKETCLS